MPIFPTCRLHPCVVPDISIYRTVDRNEMQPSCCHARVYCFAGCDVQLSKLDATDSRQQRNLQLLCTSSGRPPTNDAGKPTTTAVTLPENSDSALAACPVPPWKPCEALESLATRQRQTCRTLSCADDGRYSCCTSCEANESGCQYVRHLVASLAQPVTSMLRIV